MFYLWSVIKMLVTSNLKALFCFLSSIYCLWMNQMNPFMDDFSVLHRVIIISRNYYGIVTVALKAQ